MRVRLHSLRLRLGLGMSLGVALLCAMLLAVTYLVAREQALRSGEAELLDRQRIIATGLGAVFADVEQRALELGIQLRDVRPNREQLLEFMKSLILYDPDVCDVFVALDPGNPVSGDSRFAVNVAYGVKGINVLDFVATGYLMQPDSGYWTKSWYIKTVVEGQAWWSEPYFNDAAGGHDVVTYDVPVVDPSGRRIGMTSLSLSLERIIDIAGELGLHRHSGGARFLLIDGNQRLISAWERGLERAYTIKQAAARSGLPALKWLAETPVDGDAVVRGSVDAPERGREIVLQQRIPGTQWRIATLIHSDQLLQPLHATSRQIAGVALLLVLLVPPLLFVFAHWLARPLQQLAQAAERIAGGELELAVPTPRWQDEVARLGQAVEQTRRQLLEISERSRVAVDVQQQLKGELDVAHRLQRSMLPDDRLFFGPQLECEMAGQLLPAQAVAGDFYGFLAPAPGICVFYLGDVSGRGVSAALFMARLSAILPGLIRQGGGPLDMMVRIAEQWAQDGSHEHTVDLLLGRIDLDGGQLSLVSAHHAAPLLLRADGSQEVPALPLGPPLGASALGEWRGWEGRLAQGERLIACSNGVLERHNGGGLAYGLERLQIAAERAADRGPRQLLAALVDDNHQFAGSRDPIDDLTVLVVAARQRDLH